MKLTNSESIQESEKEFIDTINAELDWDAIEQMLLDRHGFTVEDEVDYKDGNLIVHNNEIAYKFEFEIKVPLSVIFNREGDCLEMSTRSTDEDTPIEDLQIEDAQIGSSPLAIDQSAEALDKNTPPRGSEMASEIADMISEINSEGE